MVKFKSLQEIYDHVKQHLFTQNSKSTKNDSCVYRTADGKACAIGACIPDELYSSEMENRTIQDLWTTFPYIQDLFPSTNPTTVPKFLSQLQRIHDYSPVSDWGKKLKAVATIYGLKS